MQTSRYLGYVTSTVRTEGNEVLTYHDLDPFSSNKIRAKILDLGYGGARHEPSITYVLSAAITIDRWTDA